MNELEVGERNWTIEEVVEVAERQASLSLSRSPSWREKIAAGANFLKDLLEKEREIYGVTTGYGDACQRAVAPHLLYELPIQLTRFHGCGLGRHLDDVQARAVLVVRLLSLARGYSGVTPLLLERLADLLHHDILPLIPEEGSVGASGDLTPLSYVAALLLGERRVLYKGSEMEAGEALNLAGLTPLRLQPKEGLALMNGTSVMTALACLAFKRATYLAKLACRITSLTVIALDGNRAHFDARLFEQKPHKGIIRAAAWIREDLTSQREYSQRRLQDRYSLRCAPHIIGVLLDALPHFRETIEVELNSVNDNPLIFPEDEVVLHGGHFYGGHIAHAMDSMKTLVANLADLLDRQIALLVNESMNHGLPANLSGAEGDRLTINHGFKAVHIATSAWAAEALKLTMPASVFSRSTESHNQDKVSMGTIAARDCLRVIELTEQVAAALILAGAQGLELRRRLAPIELPPHLDQMCEDIHSFFPFLTEDRPLEATLRFVKQEIKEERWALYTR